MKLPNEDIADFEVVRDVAMSTIFLAFYIWGAHWRHLANTPEPSACGSDAALRQITLTTCYCWNQFKVIRLACRLGTRKLP